MSLPLTSPLLLCLCVYLSLQLLHVSVYGDSAPFLNSDSLPVAPSSISTPSASPSPDGFLGSMSCVCVAKLLRPLLLYGNTSTQFISLEGVSLHLLSFNILIVLFVPTLSVDLLIPLDGLLVSITWETLINVVPIS